MDKNEGWDHWDCSILSTPSYLLQLTLKAPPTQIHEKMSASKYECHRMPCFALCKSLLACVCVCVCLPFVTRVPKREGDIVKISVQASELRGNPPQRFKEQLKVNGSLWQPSTVSPSTLMHKGGMIGGRGLFQTIIFHEWWTVKCNKSPHYCKRDLEPAEK